LRKPLNSEWPATSSATELLGEAGESRFKFAFAADPQDKNLPPE
jgi:hypothetical protein